MENNTAHEVRTGVEELIGNIRSVVSVDPVRLEHMVAAHIAGGHVLLADSHGVGKTSLARALAGSIVWDGHREAHGSNGRGGSRAVEMEDFNRVQCTVDLLPQDILGYYRMSGVAGDLVFNKGPMFSHFVLCDEINLLTPKTQGSFFQAMEEQEVTIEGSTYRLEDPFFIIATMNLRGSHLFPLPAPQLDRFMVQLSMGYPTEQNEQAIVAQHGRTDGWQGFRPVVRAGELLRWKALVDDVYIDPDVIRYIVECVRATREHAAVLVGASPRTGVKVSRMARALSLIRGETYTTVDTVKEVMPAAVTHRLVMKNSAQDPRTIVDEVLETTVVEANRSRS